MYKNLAEVKLFFVMPSSRVWFYIEIHLRSSQNAVSAALKSLLEQISSIDKPAPKKRIVNEVRCSEKD